MDAAIAANAVLGVTTPEQWDGRRFCFSFTGMQRPENSMAESSGWAPRGLSVEFSDEARHTSMPGDGIHSVTVPGAVEGWSQAHRRFGRLPWKDLFFSGNLLR